jgi:hypothetical protein
LLYISNIIWVCVVEDPSFPFEKLSAGSRNGQIGEAAMAIALILVVQAAARKHLYLVLDDWKGGYS